MWYFAAILGSFEAVIIEIACYVIRLLWFHCNLIWSNLLPFRIVFPANTVNINFFLHGTESTIFFPWYVYIFKEWRGEDLYFETWT